MLKRLRTKFIALNMAMVAVVLVVVFTAICVINYQQSLQSVYAALSGAVSHAGEIEIAKWPLGEGFDGTLGGPPNADAENGQFAPPEIGGQRGGTDQSIPLAVYNLHDGTLTAVPTMNTATLSGDVLANAAAELTDMPEGAGALDALGLYYEKRTVASATYIAFADMSATSSWQNLALTLTGVGLAALAVFFVISVFFSRWALRPVAQAWDRQQRFVADASHDLKTPLTVILANSAILMEHPERSIASQSQWVESTQNEASHMQELVADLLLLAQLDEEAGGTAQAAASFERIDLSDLVEGELLEFESVAYERGVNLEQHLAPGIAVQGNATRLRRLTTTLIDNACKYADGGGTVSVALRKDDRSCNLDVHNTGTPIAAEDLPHVFDRFYRADKARTRDDSGHGLGLAIARAIAEEHGGTLGVASSQAEGTTFTATLPLSE